MTQATAIQLHDLGKMYTLFRRPADKVFHALGLDRWMFWQRSVYQEFWALRGINLEVRAGERVGIIGQNGAGKSTLLKLMTGGVTATEGTIRVRGRIQALLELGTGFHPEFSGRQNLWASLALNGLTPRQISQKENGIIDFAELEDFIDQPLRTYSAGMYARLAFSTATAVEPEILIIDEVLGAGDAYFSGKCVERMKRLTRESGATVLFVSHDLASVQALCQRVLWIHRGRIRQDGDPLSIIKQYMAMVRKQEEIRLRARDLKVLKKQAVLLEKDEDIYDKLLFHFLTADGIPPQTGQQINSITLFVEDQEVGRIDVGSPMDNSADHLNYVMDSPGYMDWGPARRNQEGPYREYIDCAGSYGHAPFEFAVAKTFLQGPGARTFRLEISARVSQEILVELYDQKEYVQVGVLRPGRTEHHFEFSGAVLEGEEVADVESHLPAVSPVLAAASNLDDYGKGGARIASLKMAGPDHTDSRVFYIQDPLSVTLEFEAFQELRNPVFVFCIYLPDGKCASQWMVSSEELGSPTLWGRGQVTFHIDRLVLGKSAYVASAAIFKYLRSDGQEPEAYHVMDRCIHFQVLQRQDQVYDHGLSVQSFSSELSQI